MPLQVKRQDLISYLQINPSHLTNLFFGDGIYSESFNIATDIITLTEDVLLWLSKKNVDVDHLINFIESKNKKNSNNFNNYNNILDNNFNIEDYEQLTLKEICEQYNGIAQFNSHIKARKVLIDTELKSLQIKEKKGELISKQKVVKACFGIIDISFKRLLDLPSGIYERVKSLAATDSATSRVEAEEAIINQISKILNGAKKEISDLLGEVIQNE